MTTLLLPNISDEIRDRLLTRARVNGRSVEEEASEILRAAVTERAATGGSTDEGGNLGTRIASRFSGIGIGLDEPIRELRGWTARPAEFDVAEPER